MATVRKVEEKAFKAAAKSTSNYSPAPHGGPTPLCGLEILGSFSIRLSAVIGSSHALSRARGCRSRSAAHFLSVMTWVIRFSVATMRLRKKRMGVDPAREILANLPAIWHDRNSEQRRFLSRGPYGWSYLLLSRRTF